MKSFLSACKRRPLILWILLFAWIIICTLMSFITVRDLHTPEGLLFYLFLAPPICHLIIFVKPLKLIEILQIIAVYLVPVNITLDALIPSIPSLWFTISSVIFGLISLVLFILEFTLLDK